MEVLLMMQRLCRGSNWKACESVHSASGWYQRLPQSKGKRDFKCICGQGVKTSDWQAWRDHLAFRKSKKWDFFDYVDWENSDLCNKTACVFIELALQAKLLWKQHDIRESEKQYVKRSSVWWDSLIMDGFILVGQQLCSAFVTSWFPSVARDVVHNECR